MPLYDYECKQCGKVFEEITPISDRNDIECVCGSPARRIVSGGKFLLVGGGWTGRSHPIIHPPKGAGVDSKDEWKTNYYNCTPESVHKN